MKIPTPNTMDDPTPHARRLHVLAGHIQAPGTGERVSEAIAQHAQHQCRASPPLLQGKVLKTRFAHYCSQYGKYIR